MLVRAASEIQQAEDNCLEAGSSSVCGVSGSKPSGGKSKKSACHSCNTMNHSEQGFTDEVRKKFCKAYKAECKKCLKTGHFTEFCFKGLRIKNCDAKKAKVNEISAETAASDTPAPAVVETPASVAAAPVAALNSAQQVQKEYSFNPDRYQDYDAGNSGWWSVGASIPIQVQRLWGPKWKQVVHPSPWVTSYSTMYRKTGGEPPRRVMPPRKYELSWTEGATLAREELRSRGHQFLVGPSRIVGHKSPSLTQV